MAAEPGGTWASFDRWAGRYCLALALLAGIVGLLLIGPAVFQELHPVVGAVLLAVAAAEAVLLYLVSVGLGRRSPWARRAALWVLWLGVLTGFGGVLVDFPQGRITIPLGAIAAALILLLARRPLPPVSAGETRRATAVGLSFLLLLLLLLALPAGVGFATTNPASPLVANAADLDLDLALDVACSGDGSAMPDRIDVRARWTWHRRDAFPGRRDAVGIGRSSPDGESAGFYLDGSAASSASIVPVGAGASGAAVAAALFVGDSWSWSVGDEGQTAQDGYAEVTLVPRAGDPTQRAADRYVILDAVFAHLDRWTVRQASECRWGAEATAR